jgi:hypothetical protein
MKYRFVHPEVVRLPLSDGDWIEVKKELNAGESRNVFTKLVKSMKAGESAELDPAKVGITRILEYLVAWSFTDASGKAVPVSEAAVNNLRPDAYREVMAAIDAHDKAIEEAQEAEKNAPAGSSTSEPT